MTVYSELFLGANLLPIFSSSKKLNLQCEWKFFVFQSLFKIKIKLDLIVGLRRLGTFNVHIIYNMQLFDNHTVSYWVTSFINKGGKMKKITQPSTIFPSFIWHFLKLKYSIISFLWLTKIEKSCFWPKCLNEISNFQENWWIIIFISFSFLT
jgi:hypothetical protein